MKVEMLGTQKSAMPISFSNFDFLPIYRADSAGSRTYSLHLEPPWVRGTNVCSDDLGHMTKMAATPIYGKNPSKSLLLRNQRANDLVAWYGALGPLAHHSLFK